jgi:hypothetical protein
MFHRTFAHSLGMIGLAAVLAAPLVSNRSNASLFDHLVSDGG